MQALIVQSFVAAPPDSVWAALFAQADLLFDGLPADAWPEEREAQAPLHVDAAWPWTPAPTRVTVTLHELGGGTRMDIRHAGWQDEPEWEEPLQGHFAGWLQGTALLGLHVETGIDGRASGDLRGRERYLISGEIPAPAAPVYRSLTDEDVLERWSDDLLAAPRTESIENRLVRWRFPDGREVVAILRPTPRGTHVALAEYGATDRGASGRWPGMFERLTTFLV